MIGRGGIDSLASLVSPFGYHCVASSCTALQIEVPHDFPPSAFKLNELLVPATTSINTASF